jgi:hypothetical protein
MVPTGAALHEMIRRPLPVEELFSQAEGGQDERAMA